MTMVNKLNSAKRLIFKHFGLGAEILMHIPGKLPQKKQVSQNETPA
jgi:hypothetical protein